MSAASLLRAVLRPRNLALGLAGLAAGLYLVVALLMLVFQDALLFPAPRGPVRMPPADKLAVEMISLVPEPGEHDDAWWVPAENARGACIFSHGNGASLGGGVSTCVQLHDLGLSVLAYDYGGYGASSGKPSEQRLYADIRAAWKYVTETKGIPADRVILFGRSLGGAPTAQLASEVRAGGVVLESTFTSLPGIAQEAFPFVPARWLVHYRFDTLGKAGAIHSPLLVIHAPEDDIVPYHHGQEIFAAAAAPKTFLEIHGRHNTGFNESRDVYLGGWRRFIDSTLSQPH